MRAMKTFVEPQTTFKGEGFKGWMEPLRSKWEATTLYQLLVYLVFTTHYCTTNYKDSCGTTFYEMRATRGRCTRQNPEADFQNAWTF